MAESRPSDVFEELEDIIECGLCLDICKDPRVLPCQHWFGTKCIQQLIDKSVSPSMFNCPSCRTEIKCPEEGANHFPAAFFVNQLDEVIRRRKEAQPSNQTICSNHKKTLDAYCVTCKQTLCITCMLAHDGHEKLMISEMQQKMKLPIQETSQAMKKQLQECEGRLNEIGKAKLDSVAIGEVTKRKLNDYGKKMKEKLDQAINNMEKKIDEKISESYDEIATSLKSDISERAAAILRMEASLTEESLTEIIDLQPYNAIMKNLDLCHPVPELKIDMKLPEISQVTDEDLVGTITCSGATEPQTVDKVAPSSGQNVRKIHQFDLPCNPRGIACDLDGNVAVCASNSPTVHIFTQEGRKLLEISCKGLSDSLWDIAATKDRWYITEINKDSGSLFIYDKAGQHIYTVPVGYKGEGGGLAVSDSHIYITSELENCVYRLNLPDGSNKKVFIKNNMFIKYLDHPWFVATNGKHVAVSSVNNHQVSVFDKSGARKFVYSGKGAELGKLIFPCGVAIDGDDNVLVADAGVNMVSSKGHYLRDLELGDRCSTFSLALTGSGRVVLACKEYNTEHYIMVYQYS